MKYLWIFLSCVAFGSLAAETIGNVEYSIPQDWIVGKETIDRIYRPVKIPTTTDEIQLFSISYNNAVIGVLDQAALQTLLQRQFPAQTVTVSVLETAPNDIIFEWSLTKEKSTTYAWSRIISSTKGYAWISGLSGSQTNIEAKRIAWVSLLKEASPVQN